MVRDMRSTGRIQCSVCKTELTHLTKISAPPSLLELAGYQNASEKNKQALVNVFYRDNVNVLSVKVVRICFFTIALFSALPYLFLFMTDMFSACGTVMFVLQFITLGVSLFNDNEWDFSKSVLMITVISMLYGQMVYLINVVIVVRSYLNVDACLVDLRMFHFFSLLIGYMCLTTKITGFSELRTILNIIVGTHSITVMSRKVFTMVKKMAPAPLIESINTEGCDSIHSEECESTTMGGESHEKHSCVTKPMI
jgi:hypothetical protein